MPTYEYECGACGHRFEKFQSMNDKPIKKCPQCGKAKAERVISGGAGVLFKGSGFYSTDNKKSSALTGGNGNSRDKEKTAEKPKDSSGDATASSKPAAEKTPAS